MGITARLREMRRGRRRRVRIAIVGGGPEADLLARGYGKSRSAELVAAVHPDPAEAKRRADAWGCESHCTSLDELLGPGRLDAVEILAPLDRRADLAVAALAANTHVSVLKPMARDIGEARRLVSAASRTTEIFLRVNDPLYFYPPYVKAREMVRSGEVGEIGSIRIKTAMGRPGAPATFGASGGWPWPGDLAPGAPEPASYLFNLCVDKFGLAADLAGEVELVAAYLNDLDGVRGGQGHVIWKCREPGRFGVMEVVRAPEMQIRSDYFACDDSVEMSGTDGILWVNHCTARMTEAPAIEVRRGRTYYTLGAECGLRTDWADAWLDSADHFASSILRGRPPRPGIEAGKQALQFLLAARLSAATGEPVEPDSIV